MGNNNTNLCRIKQNQKFHFCSLPPLHPNTEVETKEEDQAIHSHYRSPAKPLPNSSLSPFKRTMSVTGPVSHPRNLNPTAPEFSPATNPHQSQPPFFIPTRIYFPLPPPPPPPSYPSFFHLPPLLLPPISVIPTRAVMLLPVPSDVTESSIRQDMELFGEVRGVQMERSHEGIVTVHFYNLRNSQRALNDIRYRHMQQQLHFTTARGLVSNQPMWAHFVFPQLNAVPEGNNQGSLVIMNLEPTVSSTTLRHIFQVNGKVLTNHTNS